MTGAPLKLVPPADTPAGRGPAALLARWSPWGAEPRDREQSLLGADWVTFDVVAAMTCLLLVVHGETAWFIRTPILALCAAGLLYRPLARQAAYWLTMSFVLVAGHAQIWERIDNHKWLLTYWCLALGISLLTSRPTRTLAVNARLLIGLCFLFATAWKIASPEFRSGTFFHFVLITDPRFRGVTDVVGGVGSALTASNLHALRHMQQFASTVGATTFHSSVHVELMAAFMTAWTIAIEGLIAVAFLWPEGRGLSKARDAILIAFLITTYPIASVVGFGWLLVTMGLAQSAPTFRRTREAYLLTFLILPLYKLPFVRLARAAVGWVR